jgi:hypothetical protein
MWHEWGEQEHVYGRGGGAGGKRSLGNPGLRLEDDGKMYGEMG